MNSSITLSMSSHSTAQVEETVPVKFGKPIEYEQIEKMKP
jgi:hypothetical protein